MSDEIDELKKIFEDDPLGLLDVQAKENKIISADDRLIASFNEINQFIDKTGKLPTENPLDINEYRLKKRLDSFNDDLSKIEILKEFDTYKILKQVCEVNSIDEIFSDDSFDLLSDETESIFTLKNIPVPKEWPDYIAKRKPCKDFDQFERLFQLCHSQLAQGQRQIRIFSKEQQIEKGNFFLLKGLLVYVAEVGEKEEKKGKVNARLRCIFENGTECDLLLRSLASLLYKDGKRITLSNEEEIEQFFQKLGDLTDQDDESGYIYIAKSLSNKNEIASIRNLFKVGFSKLSPEERIKKAHQDPTFLMAPVSIVASYKCFNLNPQKFELLLHTFFAEVCLNIDVYDEGKRLMPREWFIAPLEVINRAIELLLTGEIINFKYDRLSERIILKENQ